VSQFYGDRFAFSFLSFFFFFVFDTTDGISVAFHHVGPLLVLFSVQNECVVTDL
jgi:hypothetical protein